MKQVTLNIEGMTCSACSNGLEKYLNKQDGVEATVNLVMGTVLIKYDENKTNEKQIEKYIEEAGFKSLGEKDKRENRKLALVNIIIFSIIAILLMINSYGHFIPIIDMEMYPKNYVILLLIISLASLIWGLDIIKNGIKNLKNLMPNMDSLIGLGVIVNFSYSLYNAILILQGNGEISKIYFESVLMIILFVKIGRFIDKKNKERAVEAIKNLVTMTPQKATIKKDSQEIEVTLNEVKKGDIVICKPGEKVAVDGEIVKGSCHVDESFITGESKPVKKVVGSNCLAGSINYDGYIEYVAQNIGKDSSISQIANLVVEATNSKSPIAKMADKISGYFVPLIFLVSLISFLLNLLIFQNLTQSIEAMVTVLVVACPCALGIAVPLCMVVSIGKLCKEKIVVKDSEVIEALNKIDTVVFDKTGTLTKGKLEIADKKIKDEKEGLKILQSLEKNSNHPIAKSICEKMGDIYTVTNFEEVSGKGVKGIINNELFFAGNRKYIDEFKLKNSYSHLEEEYSLKKESIVYLWNEKEILGIIGLRDEIKDGVKEVIDYLYKINKKVVMLSGDNQNTANMIAKELNIKEVYSDVTPLGKVNLIKELNTMDNVVMIGDGINDSPALKTARIGISVANGTDISNDSADIIMLSQDMRKLKTLFDIGRKTEVIIKQNLFWTLFYNILMIPLASNLFPIKLNPMLASLAMVISSLTVVLNSLRLKK